MQIPKIVIYSLNVLIEINFVIFVSWHVGAECEGFG